MSAGDRLQLRIREVPIPGTQLWQGAAAGKDPGACMEVTFALSLAELQRDLSGEPPPVAVKPGGWQRHYSLVWRRFLSAVAPLGPSRAVSPVLIVVFPRSFLVLSMSFLTFR